ncbi:hypothetical protein PP176A_0673 [Sporanaerobacter sp. PP17-6a]|nr:hypothetical protein PP176A_0673 [Sporanaerobacter sp. PP17-6a]
MKIISKKFIFILLIIIFSLSILGITMYKAKDSDKGTPKKATFVKSEEYIYG